MNKPNRYPELSVSGPPRQLGQQIGESAREQVRGFCEIAFEQVSRTVRVSKERAYEVARRSQIHAARYRPDLIEELCGTAEAAGVTLDDVMLLQIRNQLQSDKSGGCTSVSFTAEQGVRNVPVVAQTWDNDPVLDKFTIVLTRHPQDKPAFTSCTQAGLISYMGFSETGIGACVNTLPAPSRNVGVPHYFILREIYEATSLDEAVRSVRRAYRAIPVNIMMSTPQGPANLEVTVDDVRVLHPDHAPAIAHTNHCVHQDFEPINSHFPELAQSFSRKTRIDKLLAEGSREADLDQIKQMLSDHDNFPQSICRHPSDDPLHGFWETVFAIIVEPELRRMLVSRGTPCNHPFEEYQMLPS